MGHGRKSKGRSQAVATPSRNGKHQAKKTKTARNGAGGTKKKARRGVEDQDDEELDRDDDQEDEDAVDGDDEEEAGDLFSLKSLGKRIKSSDGGETEEQNAEHGSSLNGKGAKAKRAADEFVGSLYQHEHGNQQPCIRVPLWAIPLTSSAAELVVLSQFAYWFSVGKKGRLRAKVKKSGYYWVYKTYNQLAEETKLTRDQVIRAIKNLKEAKILLTLQGLKKDEVPHYRLNPVKIREFEESGQKRLARQELARKRAAGKGKKSKSKKPTSKKGMGGKVGDEAV